SSRPGTSPSGCSWRSPSSAGRAPPGSSAIAARSSTPRPRTRPRSPAPTPRSQAPNRWTLGANSRGRSSSVVVVAVGVGGGVVCRQQVLAPVVLVVAPDGVDVVGVILGVVILDQEARFLDGVVVALAVLFRPRPGESDAVESRHLDPPPGPGADLVGRAGDVVAHQLDQVAALLASQVGVADAIGRQVGVDLAEILGQDVVRRDWPDDGHRLLLAVEAAQQ